jgi:hypothetical protein
MTRLAFVAIAVLALAGCGAAQSSAEQAVSESPEKTAEAGTSRFTVSFGESPVMSGAFDYENGSGAFAKNNDMPEMIWTREAVYTPLDFYAFGVELQGKRWIETNLQLGASPLFLPFANSPSELLGFLRAASDVEKLETGSERGVDVTRYRAQLRMDRAIEELPKDQRESMRVTIKEYWADAAEAGIPVDLAIDGEGRLRKVSMPIPEASRLTLEFYDYGAKVDVKAPPADQVLTWEEFNDAMKQACEGVDEQGFGDSDEVAACATMMFDD